MMKALLSSMLLLFALPSFADDDYYCRDYVCKCSYSDASGEGQEDGFNMGSWLYAVGGSNVGAHRGVDAQCDTFCQGRAAPNGGNYSQGFADLNYLQCDLRGAPQAGQISIFNANNFESISFAVRWPDGVGYQSYTANARRTVTAVGTTRVPYTSIIVYWTDAGGSQSSYVEAGRSYQFVFTASRRWVLQQL